MGLPERDNLLGTPKLKEIETRLNPSLSKLQEIATKLEFIAPKIPGGNEVSNSGTTPSISTIVRKMDSQLYFLKNIDDNVADLINQNSLSKLEKLAEARNKGSGTEIIAGLADLALSILSYLASIATIITAYKALSGKGNGNKTAKRNKPTKQNKSGKSDTSNKGWFDSLRGYVNPKLGNLKFGDKLSNLSNRIGTILSGIWKYIGQGKMGNIVPSGAGGNVRKIPKNFSIASAGIGLAALAFSSTTNANKAPNDTPDTPNTNSSFPTNGLKNYSEMLKNSASSVDLLSAAQTALNVAMFITPMGRLIKLGITLYGNWDAICEVLNALRDNFKKAFPEMANTVETGVNSIIESVSAIPEGIMNSLRNIREIFEAAFGEGFAWLSEKLSWVTAAFSKIPILGGGVNIPGDIQSNARGGIITRPILTTFAEEGPEAAIPLDGSRRAIALWHTAGRMLGMYDQSPVAQLAVAMEQTPPLTSLLPAKTGVGMDGGVTNNVHAPISITVNGNADEKTVQQIQQAAQNSLTELKRQLKELQWQEKRLSFD